MHLFPVTVISYIPWPYPYVHQSSLLLLRPCSPELFTLFGFRLYSKKKKKLAFVSFASNSLSSVIRLNERNKTF